MYDPKTKTYDPAHNYSRRGRHNFPPALPAPVTTTTPELPGMPVPEEITESNVLVDGMSLPVSSSQLFRLLKIFTVKRPHNSETEKNWVEEFVVKPYLDKSIENKRDMMLPQYAVVRMGPMENIVIFCDMHKNNDTLFSCHTDTVHWKEGKQEVLWDTNTYHAYKKDNECLGADDGTGVWLMQQMLDAGVPGTYVFHRGEERGCIGSFWMKNNKQEWLKGYKRAIAFDRRDTTHVITSQRGRVCCSNGFADVLAFRLNKAAEKLGFKFDYAADPTGVYTDTANYTAFISECTNISIGYEGAHGGGEMQDVEHATQLAEVLTKVDWATIPTFREAKEDPPAYQYNGYGTGRYSGPTNGVNYANDTDSFVLPWAMANKYNAGRKALKKYEAADKALEELQQLILEPPDTLEDFDRLLKKERMAFTRVFPEQTDMILTELLRIYRKYYTLVQQLADEKKAKEVAAAVVATRPSPATPEVAPAVPNDVPPAGGPMDQLNQQDQRDWSDWYC